MIEQDILDKVIYGVARDSIGAEQINSAQSDDAQSEDAQSDDAQIGHAQTLAVLRYWLDDYETLRRYRPLILIRYRVAVAYLAPSQCPAKPPIIKPQTGILDRVMAEHFAMARRHQPG